jgi:hypothetical protein
LALFYKTRAYEMRKIIYRDNLHPDLADSLHSLAISFYLLNDLQKALEFGNQAKEMREKL